MNGALVVGVVVIVAVALVIGLALRGRSTDDGVASFQRQIDALSPEARRPTVDQVRSVEPPPPAAADRRTEGDDDGASTDDAEGT